MPTPLDVQNLGKFWVTLEQFAGDRREVLQSAGYQLEPKVGGHTTIRKGNRWLEQKGWKVVGSNHSAASAQLCYNEEPV